jgi:RES domain-containing protein
MLVYRIVTHRYSNDLNGKGASLYGGRWNEIGTAILYAAQHRSLALCEMMVNLDEIQLEQDFDILTISVPDKSKHKKLTTKQLPDNWKSRFIQNDTKLIGNKFAAEKKYLSLEVPSVVIPEESNFLINPLHEDFQKVKIVERKQFIFDRRLF